MIVASVRQSLKVPGRSVSIRESVQKVNMALPPPLDYKFPLSLRKFIGALTPGRVVKKDISLDFLQRKLDEFINDRAKPLLKLRLHGSSYGSSKLEIYFDVPLKGMEEPYEVVDLDDLKFTALGPSYYFNDLNSDRITVSVIRAQPVGIEAQIHFETEGEELKINNFFNVNFVELYIKLKLEFGKRNGQVDLFPWLDEIDVAVDRAEEQQTGDLGYISSTTFRGEKVRAEGLGIGSPESAKQALKAKLARRFIAPHATVKVTGLDDEAVAAEIVVRIFDKVFKVLEKKSTHEKQSVRDILNQYMISWLVGGNFHVREVVTNAQTLTIEFILPLGQLDPFPEEPQPPLDQERLANIGHIVVLMMENRSFDHMLGYLSKEGGRRDIDGLRGGEKNIYKGKAYFSSPLPDTIFEYSPCHEHKCVDTNQINRGKMDGFVADYAARAEAVGIDPGLVMGYHNAAQVPVYDALSREFLICQRWFAAHPGPTFPNRHYMLTGRLNRDQYGLPETNNPEGKSFVPTSAKNIFDHLTAQGIDWRYYEHGYCTLRLYERYTYDNVHIVDAGGDAVKFVADALDGNLPPVTFIDPDFINLLPGNDDQPPADITAGQRLIGRIIDALIKGPLWEKTLLIITYDEHGGFFDHVPPPQAVPVSSIDHYGVRVPTFVISPWVARGQVTDIVFDHTSILKTIIRCFLHARPPDMGERVTAAKDLSEVLQPSVRSDKPRIPLPPLPVRNFRLARKAEGATEGPRDFRELLRSVRCHYPTRRKTG